MSRFYIPIIKGTKRLPDISTIKVIGSNAFDHLFYESMNLTTVEFPELIDIEYQGMSNCFYGSKNLTSVSFPKLKSITNSNALKDCFSRCSNLTSISFPELETLNGDYIMSGCFYYCTSLTTVSFPKLKSTGRGYYPMSTLFQRCTSLQSIYFPNLIEVYGSGITNIVGNVTGCTIHFKAGTESTISALTSYPNFGGTNTVLAFDL